MDFLNSPVVTNIGILFGILFFVVRYFFSDRTAMTNYKTAAESYETRVKSLEDENKQLREQNLQLERDHVLMKADILRLEGLVTGKEMLAEIRAHISKFDVLLGDNGMLAEFRNHDNSILNALSEIKGILTPTGTKP
jgi:hypothetical protein